jgi:hypothetical protein
VCHLSGKSAGLQPTMKRDSPFSSGIGIKGSQSDGSSFFGLFTRGEISHIRIWSACH